MSANARPRLSTVNNPTLGPLLLPFTSYVILRAFFAPYHSSHHPSYPTCTFGRFDRPSLSTANAHADLRSCIKLQSITNGRARCLMWWLYDGQEHLENVEAGGDTVNRDEYSCRKICMVILLNLRDTFGSMGCAIAGLLPLPYLARMWFLAMQFCCALQGPGPVYRFEW